MKLCHLLAFSPLLPVVPCQPAETGAVLDAIQQVREEHVDTILEESTEAG